MPLKDTDLMPFGRYKGKAMANVPAEYLLWLHGEGCSNIGVAEYIQNNMDAIKLENSKQKTTWAKPKYNPYRN